MAAASEKLIWPLVWSLTLLIHEVNSFYVPGVAPINFHQNDPVEIKAVKLTSSRTQLPYEYYSLPFCQPDKITYKAENLGEVLRGDRIVNTPFKVLMHSDKKCEVLCSKSAKPTSLNVQQSKLIAERIHEDYYIHLIADNLPVATRLELYSSRDDDEKKKEKDVHFEHGYRLGFMDNSRFYLHNHLSFLLHYHHEGVEENQEDIYRVVRFEVIPQSIRLEDLKIDEKGACTLPDPSSSAPQEIDSTRENQLFFTYSVQWQISTHFFQPGDKAIVQKLSKDRKQTDFPFGLPTTAIAVTRTTVLTEESPVWIHASRLKRVNLKPQKQVFPVQISLPPVEQHDDLIAAFYQLYHSLTGNAAARFSSCMDHF